MNFDYVMSDPYLFFLQIAFMIALALLAIGSLMMRSLFALTMMAGAYSLICAMWFAVLDAVDVAFTEAAVGAGASTILMLGALLLTKREVAVRHWTKWLLSFLTILALGALLIYATLDMPAFGDPLSPANATVGRAYLEQTAKEVGVPNVVTAVLASYRGFDTLGEAMVIFCAGLTVFILLHKSMSKPYDAEDHEETTYKADENMRGQAAEASES